MSIADVEEKTLQRAKNAAYRILTYRPRSRWELTEKLREKGFTDDVVVAAVEHCARLGYIDDRSFAEQWAADRIRSRDIGRRRIEQELKQKGIGQDIAKTALSAAISADDEQEAAEKAAAKKLRTMPSVAPDVRKRRLAGFLERRGFSSDIMRRIITRLP